MGRKKMTTAERFDIRIRVEPTFHKRLAKEASIDGNSIAAFIRTAVAEKIERRERERGAKH